jgi:hypothetical protein
VYLRAGPAGKRRSWHELLMDCEKANDGHPSRLFTLRHIA